MKALLLSGLLLLAFVAAAEDRPLLYAGGDGHAYLITRDDLVHIHREHKQPLDIGPGPRVFPSQTGVFASAGDRLWLIERGKPTGIGEGVLIDMAETPEGAYLFVHQEALRVLFFPYTEDAP